MLTIHRFGSGGVPFSVSQACFKGHSCTRSSIAGAENTLFFSKKEQKKHTGLDYNTKGRRGPLKCVTE